MRRLALLGLLLVAVATLAACGSGGDSDDDGPAPLVSPESVRTVVWERSYSECSTTGIKRLALKYGVDPEPNQVTLAVGEAWAERYNGFDDAVRAGRDGCRQGLASS